MMAGGENALTESEKQALMEEMAERLSRMDGLLEQE